MLRTQDDMRVKNREGKERDLGDAKSTKLVLLR